MGWPAKAGSLVYQTGLPSQPGSDSWYIKFAQNSMCQWLCIFIKVNNRKPIASPIKKKKSINAQPTRKWRSQRPQNKKGLLSYYSRDVRGEKKKQIKEQHKVNRVWSELFFFILNAGHYCFSIFSHFQSISRLLKTELDNVVELDKYKGIKSSSIT